jgi:hypothetical protein
MFWCKEVPPTRRAKSICIRDKLFSGNVNLNIPE